VRRNVLLVDVAIALALAGLVLILSPGLAIVAIVAVAALLVCGVSFAIAGVRSRRSARHRRPLARR
jgi:drug/metabolite transporter (DMT)-like permease